MKSQGIILKPGKEKPIQTHNHWIFSGAIQYAPEYTDGDILPVYSSDNRLLGQGYFNHLSSISGRMMTFDDTPVDKVIPVLINQAWTLRQKLFDFEQTNAFRLINGEGDAFPGLVVDKYADVLVIQVSTIGIERMKKQIVEYLVELIKPKTILEKSDFAARKQENLPDNVEFLYGDPVEQVVIKENGHQFSVNPRLGHKTGFYLDQREMRKLIGEMSKGKRVLNCFSYTGGFSVYAAAAGAKHVTSVDLSREVVEQAKQNFELNKLDTRDHQFIVQDAFEFLHEGKLDYDLVILDPPAFAKKKADVENAVRGYRDLNRLAISQMPAGSYLLTCSCSYHVDHDLFFKTIQQAAGRDGREIRMVQEHHLAADHAVNLAHPDNQYLKSFLLYIVE